MSEESIRLMLRITARASVALFLCAFASVALHRLWPVPATRWLEETRRRWTLGFAASHTLHLAAIVALATSMGRERFLHAVGWVALIVGGMVYLFIYGLAVDALTGGRAPLLNSPRFQSFAHYLIWTIFALGFGGRALTSLFYLPFALAVIVALALRVFAGVQSRRAAALS